MLNRMLFVLNTLKKYKDILSVQNIKKYMKFICWLSRIILYLAR